MRLAGKVVAVTGAGRGIGRAIAERFLADGAKVAIGDGALVAKTASELGKPNDLRAVETDVSKWADVDRLVTAAVETFGKLDIMVNNAGIVRNQDFLEITERISTRSSASTSKGRSSVCRRLRSR